MLEQVEKYRYLGFVLDSNLTGQIGIDTLCKSGGRALGSIITKIKRIGDTGVGSFLKLINTCVTPILD